MKRLFAVVALLLAVLVSGSAVAQAEVVEQPRKERHYTCDDLRAYVVKLQVQVNNQETVVAGLQISGPPQALAAALIELSQLKTRLAIATGKLKERCPDPVPPSTTTVTVVPPPVVVVAPRGGVDTGG